MSKTQAKSKGLAVIPYVKGTSEALSRIFQKYRIQTAMRPHMTLRKFLVHPKDKRHLKDKSGVVYRIPCKNCDQAYIGETARNLGYRLVEHEKDVKSKDQKRFTRSERKTSESEFNKSALTDHTNRRNHVIDWENTRIVDRDNDNKRRRIREAIWIRKEAAPLNRDEGAYRLSHSYDTLFTTLPPSGEHQSTSH